MIKMVFFISRLEEFEEYRKNEELEDVVLNIKFSLVTIKLSVKIKTDL